MHGGGESYDQSRYRMESIIIGIKILFLISTHYLPHDHHAPFTASLSVPLLLPLPPPL